MYNGVGNHSAESLVSYSGYLWHTICFNGGNKFIHFIIFCWLVTRQIMLWMYKTSGLYHYEGDSTMFYSKFIYKIDACHGMERRKFRPRTNEGQITEIIRGHKCYSWPDLTNLLHFYSKTKIWGAFAVVLILDTLLTQISLYSYTYWN